MSAGHEDRRALVPLGDRVEVLDHETRSVVARGARAAVARRDAGKRALRASDGGPRDRGALLFALAFALVVVRDPRAGALLGADEHGVPVVAFAVEPSRGEAAETVASERVALAFDAALVARVDGRSFAHAVGVARGGAHG